MSATDTSGQPVELTAVGKACSFAQPRSEEAPGQEEGEQQVQTSQGTVYLVAEGTCVIQASADGNSEYEPPPPASQTFTVTKNPSEQIAFTSVAPNGASVGESYRPTVRSSLGVTLSFSTASRFVCQINGTVVTFIAWGTCTVDVRQAGSAETGQPEAQQSFTVAKRFQQITFTATPLSQAVAGESYQVAAQSSSGLPVRLTPHGVCSTTGSAAREVGGATGPTDQEVWSLSEMTTAEMPAPESTKETPEERSSELSPASLYLSAAGSCTIVATAGDDSEYEPPTPVEVHFTIAKDPSERISFISLPQKDLTVGGSYVPVVRSSADIGVLFSSATPSVCHIVVGHGFSALDLVAAGTCTIDVRQNGSSNSEPPEAHQSFTVSPETSAKTTARKVRQNLARSGIPAKVRRALLKDAQAYAASPEASRYGVHGGAYDIRAVRTTVAKTGSKRADAQKLPGSTPVYVVAMRAPLDCKQPVGAGCPSTILELEYLASTLELMRHERRRSYPDLKELGIPVHVGVSKAT